MPFHPRRGLKNAMKNGELRLGLFLGTSSPQVAEVAALAGFDYLFVDLEHGERVDLGSATDLIRAADVAGTPVIVRVPGNNVDQIGALLDHGALGVCVPHIRTREDAERAVAAARYAPVGVRAMAPYVRAAQYSGAGWDEYWQTANDEVVVMAIVEDRIGMENLEDIAAVPGLDAVWIGIGDLSQDLGVPLQMADPRVAGTVQRGLDVAKRNGIIAFTTGSDAPTLDRETRRERLADLHRQGYTMVAWMDTAIVGSAFRELLAARED